MTLRNALGTVVLGILIAFYLVVIPQLGLTGSPVVDMQTIRNQVAVDAVAQYRMAKAHGTAMDTCVAAGLVRTPGDMPGWTFDFGRWKSGAVWFERPDVYCDSNTHPKRLPLLLTPSPRLYSTFGGARG